MDPWPTFDQDSSTGYAVQLGTWTNWSKGRVLGATLTLTRAHANLLITFIAFFITFVAVRFWRISCLIAHRCYSSPEAEDALYHQRQVILRNSPSAESGLLYLMQLCWGHRQTTKNYIRRTAPGITFAILSLLAFAVASVFSSQISTAAGDEVLISSNNCGILMNYNEANITNATVADSNITPSISQAVTQAANYARQCYSSNTSGTLDCGGYVQERLKTSVYTNASCPFSESICFQNTTRGLFLDTGYLDSAADFGLNTPGVNRILYRRVAHCFPLVTEGYKNTTTTQEGLVVDYNYGPWYDFELVHNFTTQAVWTVARFLGYSAGSVTDYTLQVATASFVNFTAVTGSNFIPIPELSQSDKELCLFFLQTNGIVFVEPLLDDWYRATDTIGPFHQRGINESLYMSFSSDMATPLACTHQEQYCNPNLPEDSQCGPLSSGATAQREAKSLFESDERTSSRFEWFSRIVSRDFSYMSDVVGTLGPQALTSRANLYEGIQGPLPNNQWQLDVVNWWAISLAALQAAFVSTVSGPGPDFDEWLIRPNDSYQQELCNSQKIRTTAYASFSLFGLYFTIITGILVTLVSALLEPIMSYLQKHRGYKVYTQLEWVTNQTIQLQRLAHEELGLGTWSNTMEDIPTTEPGELLGCLDLTDPKHPRLISPNKPEVNEANPGGPGYVVDTPNSQAEGGCDEPSDDSTLDANGHGSMVSPVHTRNSSASTRLDTGDQVATDSDPRSISPRGRQSPHYQVPKGYQRSSTDGTI